MTEFKRAYKHILIKAHGAALKNSIVRLPRAAVKPIFFGSLAVLCAAVLTLGGCKTQEAEQTSGEVGADRALDETDREETAEAVSGETETAALSETVVSSTWEKMNGYDWQELYTILISVERTSQELGENVPVFALMQTDNSTDPILLIGNHPRGTDSGSYQLFITDESEDRVYELLSYEGSLLWDRNSGAFCIPEEGKKYRYSPHVLLESAFEDSDTEAPELTDLSDPSLVITSESIGAYVEQLEKTAQEGADR